MSPGAHSDRQGHAVSRAHGWQRQGRLLELLAVDGSPSPCVRQLDVRRSPASARRSRGRGRSTSSTPPMGPRAVGPSSPRGRRAAPPRPRSCVTRSTVARFCRQCVSSSSCRLARVSASRAPKGLVQQQQLGLRWRARALCLTSRFMPPDFSCGYFASRRAGRPWLSALWVRSRKQSSGRLKTLLNRQINVVVAGQPGQQRVGSGIPSRGPGRGRRCRVRRAEMPPSVGCSRPATRFSSVDLPQPEWPMSDTRKRLSSPSGRSFDRDKGCPSWFAKVMPTAASEQVPVSVHGRPSQL
jgi:hypothetical protein